MSGFLLDTNLPSELLRRKPDERVTAWLAALPQSSLFLSVITMGELRKGSVLLPPSVRRARIENAISAVIPAWFAERILPVTRVIAERWGVLEGERQLAGRPLGVADGMIAATALEHDLIVATRNVRDFTDLGVRLTNPWADDP